MTLAECAEQARTHGLAGGLGAALDTVDLDCAPGRVAAIATTDVDGSAEVIPHRMGSQVGVSFVRRLNRTDAPPDLAAKLAAVRLAVTERLIAHAVEHLATRVSAGEPLLRKQLVQGAVADLHTAVAAAHQTLSIAADVPVAMLDLHDRITVLDWEAATLVGASGYVADTGGPPWDGYVSRLIANCWIDRDGAPCPN